MDKTSSKEKNSKLFIGNLSSRTTKEDLLKLFEPMGKINELKLKEKAGNNFFAFVEYDDIRDAEAALHKLDNTELLGRDLRIEFSHSNSTNRGRDYDFKCGICKSNSHYQRDCRRKDDRGGGDRRGGDDRGPKKCYTCGKTGHISRFCPDQDGKERDRGSRRRSSSRDKYRKDSRDRSDRRRRRSDSRENKKKRKRSYSSSPSSKSGSKSKSRSRSNRNWSSEFKKVGLDSLSSVDVLTCVEHEFNMIFPDNVFENLKSFGQVAEYVGQDIKAF